MTTPDKDVVRVAIEIYDAQKKGKSHTFNSLVKCLDGRISRNDISICLDILLDAAIMDGCWKQDGNKWKRIFEISYNGMPLVEKWYGKLITKEEVA